MKVAYHLDRTLDLKRFHVDWQWGETQVPPGGFNIAEKGCIGEQRAPNGGALCAQYGWGKPVPLPIDKNDDGSCWLAVSFISSPGTNPPPPGTTVHARNLSAVLDYLGSATPVTVARSSAVAANFAWVEPELPRLARTGSSSLIGSRSSGGMNAKNLAPPTSTVAPGRPSPELQNSVVMHKIGLEPQAGGTVVMHKIGLKPRPGAPAATHTINATAGTELNPQPELPHPPPPPASPSHLNSKQNLVMHKIGLSPRPRVMTARTLPAVQLPSGWTTVGGVLRASRPGLRLRLSGNHTLVSKMARNGRLHYVLADATGRVVKRISAKASVRLLNGNTLMLQEPSTHREILLGQITTMAMRNSIRQ